MSKDNTAELPDVPGLDDFIKDDIAAPAPPQDKDPQDTPPPPATDADKGNKDQFGGDYDKLLASYKQIQSFDTKVSQENATLRKEIEEMRERLDLMPPAGSYPPPDQGQNFDDMYVTDPQEAIRKEIRVERIQEFLESEQVTSPENFQERLQTATMLKNRYPHLGGSVSGTKKLFEMADKVIEQRTRSLAQKALSSFFGEDFDIEKMKESFKKEPSQTQPAQDTNAYMPDTTGATRPGTDQKDRYVKQRENAVQKGDVDSVLSSLFKEHLST